MAREKSFDRRGLAREGDVRRRHLGRHHRDQIVRTDQRIERLDQRCANPPRAVDIHVTDVQEDHEHASARIGHHRHRLAHAVRLDTHVLRRGRMDHHVLELFDLLRRVAFDDLEVVLLEIEHRVAIVGRVRVHADVVGFCAEGRRLRLGLWRRGRLRRQRDQRRDDEGQYAQRKGVSSSHGVPRTPAPLSLPPDRVPATRRWQRGPWRSARRGRRPAVLRWGSACRRGC